MPDEASQAGLAELAASGEYVFHGSPQRLSRLEPRQPRSYDRESEEMVDDGPPAVCASESHAVATFMATMPAAAQGTGSTFYAFGRDDRSEHYFVASPAIVERLDRAHGFVHVLPRRMFTRYRGDEWRCSLPVEPVAVVEVGAADLPPITVVESPADVPEDADAR